MPVFQPVNYLLTARNHKKTEEAKVAMPRGSKPGERRGGRKPGTPNKKTVLRNAFIKAVAADPNITPLNFFLIVMRQSSQPMTDRVWAAQQALPYLHVKLPPAKTAPLRSLPRLQLRRKFDIGPKDLDFDFDLEDASGDESDDVMAQASVPREGGVQLGQVEATIEHQVPAPALDQSTAEATVASDAAPTPSLQLAMPDTGNEAAERADDQKRKAEAKALTPSKMEGPHQLMQKRSPVSGTSSQPVCETDLPMPRNESARLIPGRNETTRIAR